MNKKTYPVTNIGSVSLIMIFIVLCMVVFTVLSLSTAAADKRLSTKFQEHTSEYYLASNAAEEILEQIDEILASSYNQDISAEVYYEAVKKELMALDNIELHNEKELSYQTVVNSSQALLVKLYLYSPEEIKELDAPSFYRIMSWQEISTRERKENTMNLLKIKQ